MQSKLFTIARMRKNEFERRHIGPREQEAKKILSYLGCSSMEDLIDQTIPDQIRMDGKLDIPDAMGEFEYLNWLKTLSEDNQVFNNKIGMGYYPCIVPTVIQRNIFENPGWYTQYTPYQAEIAQGRLEALLNFQTMVSDLCGLPIANASLLDEGTAAAEAMQMLYSAKNKRVKRNAISKIWVDEHTFPQTLSVIKNRATPFNISVVQSDLENAELDDSYFAILLSYPGSDGEIRNFESIIEQAKSLGVYVIIVADILSLTLLKSPGELGADVAVGSTQRLGIPIGFGGPHAAYFACTEDFKRQIPGRIIGVSVDSQGQPALRMALQTREQHIKRERATSNICTAQALLAIMASMYGVYHGPEGLTQIAQRIHRKTTVLKKLLEANSINVTTTCFFDTIFFSSSSVSSIQKRAEEKKYNFNYFYEGKVGISLDETTTQEEVLEIAKIITENKTSWPSDLPALTIPEELQRDTDFMRHEVFNSHFSETEMLRYIKKLEDRDLSLTHSMISLGSCTMKLNATSELVPLSWPEFAHIHPFAPTEQYRGYASIIKDLENLLAEITGFSSCSLQPNSGAQGEFAGLMVIRAYHLNNGDHHRNVALIPASAHGTNPASAVMAGMKVVVVKTTEEGNIDVEDLKIKADLHKDQLAALLVTYPSTHGVFEDGIREICNIIHDNGGMVYMDGANMNAQVGLTSPGIIGADVCHLNLHKTFAIPHGGGGPGMGPICCNEKLAPFLPGNPIVSTGGSSAIEAISSAPWGSASILLISYGYIKMLGVDGVTNATKYAILNANYLKNKLEESFPILYSGHKGRVGHEFIIDFRPFKKESGVDVGDVAKRLMDYGFHAPTVSFPVPGTMMIEPTESESLHELDIFIATLLSIKKEIDAIIEGKMPFDNNPVTNAPHTVKHLASDDWNLPYSRQEACFPLPHLYENKFWPYVSKIDNTYGDRNLICTCPPIEEYEEQEV